MGPGTFPVILVFLFMATTFTISGAFMDNLFEPACMDSMDEFTNNLDQFITSYKEWIRSSHIGDIITTLLLFEAPDPEVMNQFIHNACNRVVSPVLSQLNKTTSACVPGVAPLMSDTLDGLKLLNSPTVYSDYLAVQRCYGDAGIQDQVDTFVTSSSFRTTLYAYQLYMAQMADSDLLGKLTAFQQSVQLLKETMEDYVKSQCSLIQLVQDLLTTQVIAQKCTPTDAKIVQEQMDIQLRVYRCDRKPASRFRRQEDFNQFDLQ